MAKETNDGQAQKEVITLKSHTYQPSKAEKEEEISIPTTPENLLKATVHPVKIVWDKDENFQLDQI